MLESTYSNILNKPAHAWSFLSDKSLLEKANVDHLLDQLLIAEDDNTDPFVYLNSIARPDSEKPSQPSHLSTLFYDELASDLLSQISTKKTEYTIINVWGNSGVGKTSFSQRLAESAQSLFPSSKTLYFPLFHCDIKERVAEHHARALNYLHPLLATPLDKKSDIHALFCSYFHEHRAIVVVDDVTSPDQLYTLLPILNLSGGFSGATHSPLITTEAPNHDKSNDVAPATTPSIPTRSPSNSNITSNSSSLPPLAHSGRVNSRNSLKKSVSLATSALKSSASLSVAIQSTPSGSGPSLTLSSYSSTSSPTSPSSSSTPSLAISMKNSHSSAPRSLVIVVSSEELALHESRNVSLVKIHLEGPTKELVQLAVRQMAPFLKPEETQSLVHLCNNNPKSLAALTGIMAHGECAPTKLTSLIQENESKILSVEESFQIGWDMLEAVQLKKAVTLLSNVFRGYFDVLSTCYALHISHSDAIKVLQMMHEIGFVNYHAHRGCI